VTTPHGHEAEGRGGLRVLFLDIDGVVAVPGGPQDGGLFMPSPEHVERVNQVVERTGCKVVLSSTWRFCHGMNRTQEKLNKAGATFTLFDKTPDCAQKVGAVYVGRERGAEIAEWLEAHTDVTAFAIIDDDSDMGPLADRLIQTNFRAGIQRKHVEWLVHMLIQPPASESAARKDGGR
jgi:hypothetical protein